MATTDSAVEVFTLNEMKKLVLSRRNIDLENALAMCQGIKSEGWRESNFSSNQLIQ